MPGTPARRPRHHSSVASHPDPRTQVRRDLRAFVAGASIAVAALAVLMMWLLSFVGDSAGRRVCGVLGLSAVAVAAVAWSIGDPRLPERLFVVAPAFLAAAPLAVATGSFAGTGAGLSVSIALALGAAAAYGVTRRG
jgi:hypothetical protein